MLQIIGAGLGRTGTHSLAQAIEILGLGPCYTIFDVDKNPGHAAAWTAAMRKEAVDWHTVFSGYQAAVEWPTVAFLPQILSQFPDCKVILTMRDAASWYDSAAATIFPGLEAGASNPNLEQRTQSAWKRDLILNHVFAGRYHERAYTMDLYEEHVRSVLGLVPSSRLLKYDVTEGWQPLCEFLQEPVPNVPFPWRNHRAEFLASAPDWAKNLKNPPGDHVDESS